MVIYRAVAIRAKDLESEILCHCVGYNCLKGIPERKLCPVGFICIARKCFFRLSRNGAGLLPEFWLTLVPENQEDLPVLGKNC